MSLGVVTIERMPASSISFNHAARVVIAEARRLGLVVPVFVSPPSVPGADRTVRRRSSHVVVAVRVHGRPFADVVSDVIEGVVVVNRERWPDAHHLRQRLLAAVEAEVLEAA